MKILIAEDDVTSRLMLETVLGKWGYEVVAVADGDRAWEILQSEAAPRLAILDRVMPGDLDGLELCRRLRARETDCPTYVVLLTALDGKDDIVEGLEAGANDYITKPFNKGELRARVDVGRRVVDLQAQVAKRMAELREAMSHVKVLQGILPICMHCHKIRSDQESWSRLEKYIEEHSDAQFSHGLCPECMKRYYEDASPDEESAGPAPADGPSTAQPKEASDTK